MRLLFNLIESRGSNSASHFIRRTVSLALLSALALHPAALATTVGSSAFTATAAVTGTATFEVKIYKNLSLNRGPDFGTGPLTVMNFGLLEEMTFTAVGQPTFKELRSSDVTGTGGFALVAAANTHRQAYNISLTPHRLLNGIKSIPTGAYTVTPVYAPADNGGVTIPAGAVLQPPGPVWLKTTLYYSGATGEARTVQLIFGISGLDAAAGGTASVPIDQPLGNYTGTLTLSLTTV